ncbi:urease accessory protein UreE [Cetobacterium somerae]|uniref:urease accessory protein UreE n=1 Tax=Cetobacterium somerae TaxID=188913 RepID=UPI003D766C13
MLFEKILGNIKNIKNKEDFEIERIIIKSDDLEKRILRVHSEDDNEYGISLKESGMKLENGSILYNDGKKVVIVETDLEKVLVISPKDMNQMGEIAHFLGNMHTPVKIENGKIYLHYDKYLDNTLKEKKCPFEVEYIKFKKALRHIEHSHGHHGHSHD